MNHFFKTILILSLAFFSLSVFAQTSVSTDSGSISSLKSKIEEKNTQIKQIEAEIEKYQTQLDQVGKEAESLQSSIKTLDITRNKILADVRLTESRISATNLSIQELSLDIKDKELKIGANTESIQNSMREISLIESDSLVEALMKYRSLSQFLNEVTTLQEFQLKVRESTNELKNLKSSLEVSKSKSEAKKKELVALKQELSDRNKIIAINMQDKKNLLAETKNKESNYKKVLAERQSQKEAFEKDLSEFESQLQLTIDPNSIPHTGSGILLWPLDKVTITQYFGNTKFATQNPQIYKGVGHNGIDFRASIGTKVKSSGAGIVTGTGNTDAYKGCYSYGKWVLVDHQNGLSTLYAHLSLISVSKGDKVVSGQTLGYSGNTGASTGPHLHYTVYATQGLRVEQYTKSINCKNAVIPMADPKAYLNPLSYL